jgi:glycosyltransferase involved in cell wall biosynthesis
MNVLWITNILFPDVCISLGIENPVTCGWLHASADTILEEKSNIKLAVASLYEGKEFKILESKGITYYLLPKTSNNKTYDAKLEKYWKLIKHEFLPDIVHIHGTEYPHGLAYIKACGSENVVVSIQGLVSIVERYYYGGITEWNLFKNITIRDLIRRDTIFCQRKDFKKRGKFEKEVLFSVTHLIGRTLWDKTHIWANNPNAKYHFCNETLRASFYQYKWTYQNCDKNSIFFSQAYYPLKGLQQIILALPYILRYFPNTKVYIAGNDFINNRGLRLNGFGKFIGSIIKKHCLNGQIIFTGLLAEQEMCQRYLRSHVFVSSSSIENSSNSIGEAQLLGVPCVSSYVGGVEDLIQNGESGLLYRFEEIEMLAKAVCTVFSNQELAQKLSDNSREIASIRHNKELNRNRIIDIYENIIESTNSKS